MIKFLLAVSILLIIHNSTVYSQTVILRQFPPAGKGLKVNELWSISLSSIEQESFDARLKVTVRESTKGTVLTATSSVIRINQGSRNLQGRFLEPINYDISNDGVLQSIRRTGTLPDGNYTICIDLISTSTQEIISNTCMEHEVATALAPILFSPYDAADVYDNIIVWSWFMQPEVSTGDKVVCDLIVVEIMSGQTAEEALKLNPPVIIRPNLTTAQWQTNFATRDLKPGSTYAWKVVAKAAGKVINESEIWKFKFNEPENEEFMTQFDSEFETDTELSEEEKKSISIGGKTKITVENSTNQAILSRTPTTYARIEAEPNIDVLGVPMGLNFLLTTEENNTNYNINRAVFGFSESKQDLNFAIGQRIEDMIQSLENSRDSAIVHDLKELNYADSVALENRIEELRRIKGTDIEQNTDALKMFDILTPEQELMSQIPAFGVGKVTPQFSELFMSGVAINGGLLEYNPGDLYLGGAIGKLQSNFDLSVLEGNEFINSEITETPEFYKNLYVGRLGYGKRSGNHAIFSFLYAVDDKQSQMVSSLIDSTGNVLSPENNYNIGLTTRYVDEDYGITFEGEANASVFNASMNGGAIENPEVPKFFRAVFGNEIKSGTLTDFSYAARGSYQWDEDSRINAGMRFVGPGYKSVGVAGLRTDIMQYDLRYSQFLYAKQIRLSAFLSNEQAGFILSDLNNSNMNKLGGNIELRFHQLPVIQINYVGNMQKIKSEFEEASDNGIHQLQVNASHAFHHKETRFLSFLAFNYQRGTSKDSLADFTTNIIMLNQQVSFWRSISVGIMGSYTDTKSLSEPNLKPVYTFDISFVHTPSEWMSNSLGINVNDSETGSIRSFYFSSRLRIFENVETDLRLDTRKFTNEENPQASFNETVARFIAYYIF